MLAMASLEAVTLPIYMEDVIDKAPAGTVVDNLIRKGYSYYYSNGSVDGGYNDSFIGEIVLGEDGNIYVKNPCASVNSGTYLKLEKVDGSDDQYVAHTAQCVYVNNEYDTPYIYFATRLAYTKYSDTQYGYTIEQDAEGKAVTDVFFTYKDGTLKQNCQETIDMNGQILPKEMIGWCSATGNWIGFGDACLEFVANNEVPTVLPEGAEIKEIGMVYRNYSSKRGMAVEDGTMAKCAEVGDNFYLAYPGMEKMWVKGDIDRQAGTVTFKKQFLGQNESTGVFQWMIPATYRFAFELIDEEENYGWYTRELNASEAYICKYENGSLISDYSLQQAMVFSIKSDEIDAKDVYTDITLKPYESKLRQPMAPFFNKFDEYNGMWAEYCFAIRPCDDDLNYINQEELYYTIYAGSQTPFVMNDNDYMGCTMPGVSDIPALYDDYYDFYSPQSNNFHYVNFYQDYKYVGVQAVHKLNGEEKRSEIVWYNYAPSSLTRVEAPAYMKAVKTVENGRLIIRRNGATYDVNGQLTVDN